MFIEYIKVKNFGIHEAEEVNFQDGFVVVRGRNGAGKSTLTIQAPLYAMFGSSTLDATIQDTVTTGKRESDLGVELKYGPYVVKRSKASASVVGGGVEISGQAPVSDFFYNLFGIQKGTETLVLVAEQGKAAGILNGRPTEVNSFIEALAGFGQIDELIDSVKEKFPSGSKQAYEDRLDTLQDRLVELETVGFPNTNNIKRIIENNKLLEMEINSKLSSTEFNLETARKDLLEATNHNNRITLVENDIKNKKSALENAEDKLTGIDVSISEIPVYESKNLKSAGTLLATVDELSRLWSAYIWAESLTDLEDVWEGSLEEFKRELKHTAEDVNKLTKAVATYKADIRSKKAQIVTDKVCKSCGQGVEHLHEAINQKLSREIESLVIDIKLFESGLEEKKETLDLLNKINNEHIRRTRTADLEYLTPNLNVVPHTYSVVGPQPTKPDAEAVQAASDLLAEHKASLKRLEDLRADRETTENFITKLTQQELPNLEKKLSDLGPIKDTEDLTISIDALKNLRIETSEGLKQVVSTINDSTLELKRIETEIKNHDATVKQVQEDVKETRKLLLADARNAKVVKAVRDAKPKVLEMVWEKILLTVSERYSSMLDQTVAVEKDVKGFRVDGKPVARLSGSEKTTLGIALRATLRDVFAPTCPFMFLDEPMDNADIERTAAILAALKGLGGQVIIITHEEISSSTGGQLIDLGYS